MKQNVTNIKCNFTETKSDKKELTSFFEISTPFLKLNSRFNDLFFKYDTNELNLVLWIHLTGTVNNENNPSPIASDNWVSTVIYVANKVWNQACIKIIPHYTEKLITEEELQKTLFLLNSGTSCLPPQSIDILNIIDSYQVTDENVEIMNLFIVGETNDRACASTGASRIFLPSKGLSSLDMGLVLAHEIGHLLLNYAGIDNNLNPDHLMYHGNVQGNHNGLYFDECIFARERIKQIFQYENTNIRCRLKPLLGNPLSIINTNV